jgi:hypothetical protein
MALFYFTLQFYSSFYKRKARRQCITVCLLNGRCIVLKGKEIQALRSTKHKQLQIEFALPITGTGLFGL